MKSKLQEKRKEKGMTQKKLSEKAEIDINTLKAYECGRRNIINVRYTTIKKLIKALECEENEII